MVATRQGAARRLGRGLLRTSVATLVACFALAGCRPDGEIVRAVALDGDRVELFGGAEEAHALVYLAPDCPISNRYVPEINRLVDDYSGSVRLWVVYAGGAFSPEELRAHHTDFRIDAPALLDPDFALARRTGVTVTPEAALFDRSGRLVYRGRIDNRWVEFGKARLRATEHDLRRNVDRVLAGDVGDLVESVAVGCYLGVSEIAPG